MDEELLAWDAEGWVVLTVDDRMPAAFALNFDRKSLAQRSRIGPILCNHAPRDPNLPPLENRVTGFKLYFLAFLKHLSLAAPCSRKNAC